jgi:hypothetical protein
LVEPGESANIAFLHHVLGFTVILHDRAGEAKKPPVVRSDDRSDRGLFAAPGANEEFLLGGKRGCLDVFCGHVRVSITHVCC